MARNIGNLSEEANYRRQVATAHTRLLRLVQDAQERKLTEHAQAFMAASRLVASVLVETPVPKETRPQ